MAITFTKKQKITRRLYDEFKLNRGNKPRDEYFDYDYACFLEQKIVELMCEGKERSNEHKTSNCIKHAVSSSFCNCPTLKEELHYGYCVPVCFKCNKVVQLQRSRL